jgi:aspartyl-tRNA(Asn)/glutamyl-tRNA(Gln) amidotransferase subunit A
MTFADWQALTPAAAARLLHSRVATLLPAQQRAALAWLAPEERLAVEFAEASSKTATSPLRGVPFAAKDLFDAAHLPTFAGSSFLPELRPNPTQDGAFIRDVRAAGATLAAKAHMHEFAYGITGENPHYGDCELPLHAGRTTGGSSSGSALLVKAGVVPFALATDTGGSIRVPAAFCGLYGLRLTPHHPWIADGYPLAESLDTPGFFTSNAADLRTLIDAIVPASTGTKKLKGAFFSLPGLDQAVERAFLSAAERLAEPLANASARELRALFAPAAELYALLGGAETWRIHAPFYDRYRDRYDPNVRARIDRARTLTAAQLVPAQANRDAITRAWASLFSEYDYVVLPSTPCAAPTKAECTVEMRNRILSCTVPASMANLPVLALPVPLPDTGGLTTGLQIVLPRADSPALRHALALHG